MNKELQEQVWRILPDEFKLEVVQMYRLNDDILSTDPDHRGALLLKAKLIELFGSKCLKAEPTFKVGDKVKVVKTSLKNGLKDEILTIQEFDPRDNSYLVHSKVMSYPIWLKKDEIELCAEPQETNRNLSQENANCDKSEDKYYCDNIMCCHNGESYLKPMQCDKVLCDKRVPKPIIWRAAKGEKYCYLSSNLIGITVSSDDYFPTDDRLYQNGNYFRTKELAEQAKKVVRASLMQFHKDHQQ